MTASWPILGLVVFTLQREVELLVGKINGDWHEIAGARKKRRLRLNGEKH
jgi:hypothetical protein